MRGLGWTEAELIFRLKNDSGKLAMAARVRKETTLPIKWIAARLQMGTSKSLKLMLLHWRHPHANANTSARCAQLQFHPPVWAGPWSALLVDNPELTRTLAAACKLSISNLPWRPGWRKRPVSAVIINVGSCAP